MAENLLVDQRILNTGNNLDWGDGHSVIALWCIYAMKAGEIDSRRGLYFQVIQREVTVLAVLGEYTLLDQHTGQS
jgi:hypothetical protein